MMQSLACCGACCLIGLYGDGGSVPDNASELPCSCRLPMPYHNVAGVEEFLANNLLIGPHDPPSSPVERPISAHNYFVTRMGQVRNEGPIIKEFFVVRPNRRFADERWGTTLTHHYNIVCHPPHERI